VLAYRADWAKGEYRGYGFAGVHGKAPNRVNGGPDTTLNLFEVDGYYNGSGWAAQGQLALGSQIGAAVTPDATTGALRDSRWWGVSGLFAYRLMPRLDAVVRADYLNNSGNGGGLYGSGADARDGIGPEMIGRGADGRLLFRNADLGASRYALAVGLNYVFNANATMAYSASEVPPTPDDWYSYVARSDYLQTTEFVNLTFDITPKLHLEAGTVHFHSNFSSSAYGGFWYQPQTPTISDGTSHKWNSKVGISYKALDGLLVYADAAQGFRDGGSNSGLPSNCLKNGAPLQYTPDTLTNYEIGWKSTLLQHHLVWNGAIYYMPWKNLQTLLFDPNICASSSFNANVGDARVYGMETNVQYQPTQALSLEFSASYNDSRITKNFYDGVLQVLPGERLPYVPYFSWSGNARYEVPVKDSLHGYGQFDIAHKGDMWNDLLTNGSNGLPRVLQPGYSTMNLRLGLNQTASRWMGEFYITNLTNKNAVIYTNEGNFDLRQTRNEPRVFGLRLSYRWGKGVKGE